MYIGWTILPAPGKRALDAGPGDKKEEAAGKTRQLLPAIAGMYIKTAKESNCAAGGKVV